MRFCLLLWLVPLIAGADLRPLYLDGFGDDWLGNPDTASDPAGDGGGIDLLELGIFNDSRQLALTIALGQEILQQQDNGLVLYLDTDSDSQTGYPAEGLGCELVWNFASRTGTVYNQGQSQTVGFAQLGLRILPSHASDRFEFAMALDAAPLGQPLFGDSVVHAVLRDTAPGGDRLPDSGSLELPLAGGSVPDPELISLERERPQDLRLLAWNTLFGSLFTPANQGAYARILGALSADVIAFQEIWDQDAATTAATLDQLDPRDTPWQAAKLTSGNVLASRFPITASWLVNPDYRNTAHLLQTADALGTPLLVINIHLRCCSANAQRQEEADSIIAFLRHVQQGDYPQIAANTPVVLCGDFNLVGDHQQLLTLLNGEIQDTAQYGPANPPDWDGSPLTDLRSYQLGRRDAWTWYDEGGAAPYSPGRLDYILYTDSVLETGHHGLLWTPVIPADSLSAWGLQALDTPTASDHIPRFVDLRPPTQTGLGEPGPATRPSGLALGHSTPNPFNPSTIVQWSQQRGQHIRLDAWSLDGRLVASLLEGFSPSGEHSLTFDGSQLASGCYLLSLRGEDALDVGRVLLVK